MDLVIFHYSALMNKKLKSGLAFRVSIQSSCLSFFLKCWDIAEHFIPKDITSKSQTRVLFLQRVNKVF